MKLRFETAWIFLLFLCLPHTLPAGDSPLVFLTYPIEKVRPDIKYGPTGTLKRSYNRSSVVDISLAGNEYEPFMVGVYNPTDHPVSLTRIAIDRPPDSPLSCEILRIGYIEVQKASQWFAPRKRRIKGRWPDPLIPIGFLDEGGGASVESPITIPVRENRTLMFDLYLPADSVREEETWGIALTIDDGQAVHMARVTVNISPESFDLPRTSTLATAVGFSGEKAVEKHRELSSAGFNEDRLKEDYLRLLGRHKIFVYQPFEGEIPAVRDDGDVRFDWVEFDRWTGALLDGKLFADVGPATSFRTPNPPSDLDTAELKQFWKALEQHAADRGWLDRMFFYSIDEPTRSEYARIAEQSAFIKEAAPDITVMVTEPYTRLLADSIDLWCPDMPTIGDSILGYPFAPVANPNAKGPGIRLDWSGAQLHNHPRVYRRLGEEGKRAWFYPCNSSVLLDYPNLCIDSTAQYTRALPWLAYRWDFQGMLYWHSNMKYFRPGTEVWEDPYAYFVNGEGNLLYPGAPGVMGLDSHVPVPSFRLKLLREGFEDYEYLKLCEDLKGRRYTEGLGRRVVTSSLNWSKSSGSLMGIRRKLSETIEESDEKP